MDSESFARKVLEALSNGNINLNINFQMLANLARRRKEYKGLLMQVSMFDRLSTKEVSPNFQL